MNMNKPSLVLTIVLTVATVLVMPAPAQNQTPTNHPAITTTDDKEATYTHAIEKRTADILAVLGLNDSAGSNRVHDVIITQYRSLRSWHDTNDARLKALRKQAGGTDKDQAGQAQTQIGQVQSSLKALHDQFIARLTADLTPEQVEKVKDKMTYNKVQVTYRSYCEIVPNLTEEQKARILELLKEAREEAMDCGSAEEKTAVFQKCKGKINNYLSQQGHNVSKAYKDWGEKQREKSAANTNPPAQ
jgi:Spy/CpxP family protein refolding chaperone